MIGAGLLTTFGFMPVRCFMKGERARYGILLMGMAALLVFGTWGWTYAANAVNDASVYNALHAALVVYGIAFGILILGGAFAYFVFTFFRSDENR
jgi:hypothetical protein